jgi:ribonuclease HI
MATIKATLHKKEISWVSDAVFVACDQTNAFKNAETVIHPRVAAALGLYSDGFIRITIENKSFKFHTIIRNINADFWISYNPSLIAYTNKRTNTLVLRHGKNLTTDLPVPAIFNPVLFGEAPQKIPLDYITIYFDGCCKGNPGYGGYGYAIYYGDEVDESDTEYLIAKGFGYLKECTSNVSEYNGLIEALLQAKRLNAKNVLIRGDSELVVNQILREYRVRSSKIVPLYDKVMKLLTNFDVYAIEHVYRDENEEADALANESLLVDGPHFLTKYFWKDIQEFRSYNAKRNYY